MATLLATFSPATASVRLTIAGSSWSTVPAYVTATRHVPGGAAELVRGVVEKQIVAGYLVAVDHEMPLASSVTYTVTGYSAAGAVVDTAVATVSTSGSPVGLWVKAPGRPDLSVLTQLTTAPSLASATIGGVYQVIGGEAVAVGQWGGLAARSGTLTVRTSKGAETAALGALLDVARIVLLQPSSDSDLKPGWYFIGSATPSNPGGFADFSFRLWQLDVHQVSAPAGQQGGSTWTWDSLVGTYATWDAVKAAYASWFAVEQGPA